MKKLNSYLENPKSNTFLFIFILCFYLAYLLYINNFDLKDSNFPYYSWLLDSFLKGKLDVFPYTNIDLSLFKNKWYLNWGPAAVLYILPYKIILGKILSDKIYTFLGGILNIIVFNFLVKEFMKYSNINFSKFYSTIIILFFALSSPNFYLSMGGRIWLTEQVVAVFYILCSLYFLFKFLNSMRLKLFIVSVIFFNLAWLTRAPLIFHSLIFIGVAFHLRREKSFYKLLFVFFSITLISILTFLTYNYLRFGNILDTGLIHHLGNPRYQEVLSKNEIFSPNFIPYNFYYFFLNVPQINLSPPKININLEGESIFVFYPLTILLIIFFKKFIALFKQNYMIRSMIVVIFFEIVLLLNYFATGWTQVGARYFFDLIPIIFLLSLFVIDKLNRTILISLLIISSLLNVFGATVFFRF